MSKHGIQGGQVQTYRIGHWYDTKRGREVFVIEAKVPKEKRIGRRAWRGCCDSGRPLCFDFRYDACGYLRMLRREGKAA